MKTCSTCKIEKNYDEFHENKRVKSGYMAACKICKRLEKKRYKEKNREKILEESRIYARKRYSENAERERERHKKWIEENPDKYKESSRKSNRKRYLADPEKVKKKNKEYNEKNREKVRERSRIWKKKNYQHVKKKHYEYWARYPEKYKATRAVNNAIASGKMQKPETCIRCPSTESIEGHHPDYSKPLEVMWLCRKCHVEEHRELNKEIK